MTDRELLEKAAKAAGAEERFGHFWLGDGVYAKQWNPLEDDGDALRLAVKLSLVVNIYNREDGRGTTAIHRGALLTQEPHHTGAEAATRRAIVRAAASL